MKIELTELPTIRELLDELQRNAWTCDQLNAAHPTEEFRVEDREKNELHVISREELLTIFQARVDATSKHLRQRYQIDFVPAPQLIARAIPVPTGGLTEDDEDDDLDALTA